MDKMKKLMEMLSNEEKPEMDDARAQAKMDILRELMQIADSAESSDITDGLQKVTVAAPDEEGLMEGLEKAEEIVEEMPEKTDMSEMAEEMMVEGDDMDDMDDEEDEDEKDKDKVRI